MQPDACPGTDFALVLETCRHFLLMIASAELPPDLRAKGGASDLVQDSLIAAHAARHQFRGRTVADLRAWLRTILHNELFCFCRRYRGTGARDVAREVALVPDQVAAPVTPVIELVRRERDAELAVAVARLSPPARLAVVLRIDQNLTFAEIGARLERTEEAARKLFVRSLEELRATPGLTG